MTLERLLVEAARFHAALREHDIALDASPIVRADGSTRLATSRAGGEYVLDPNGSPPGVWLHGSEDDHHWLATDAEAWLTRVGHGFTTGDCITRSERPSHRPLPGVLRWLERG